MKEQAIYNEETQKWHRADADFSVRDSSHRGPVQIALEVQASSAVEAFELLYGHPLVIPPPVRAPRRDSAFEVA